MMNLEGIKIEGRQLIKPKLLFWDSNVYRNPYGILVYGPKVKPETKNIEIWAVEEQLTREERDYGISKMVDLLTNDLGKEIPFKDRNFSSFYRISGVNFPIVRNRTVSLKNLTNELSKLTSGMVLIIHKGKVRSDIYEDSKLQAKISGVRIQYFDISHLVPVMYHHIFGLFTQMIAKANGTPWIIENSPYNKFQERQSIIIGIAFTTKWSKINYGIAHFLNIKNLKQVMEVRRIKGRTDDSRGLFLQREEMTEILTAAIDWHSTDNNKNDPLDIYLYKTTPLHVEERRAIEDFLANQTAENQLIRVAHIHIKSSNPKNRVYDTDSVGPKSTLHYMPKQGQVVEIISTDNIRESNSLSLIGQCMVSTTGIPDISGGRDPIGTPNPFTMEIHANWKVSLPLIENQVMAMSSADWEATGKQYQSLFILKYANKLASYLSRWSSDKEKNSSTESLLPRTWDIRDLM